MADLKKRIVFWIASRSVFSLLLITTVLSTLSMSFVLVLALQRVADEHPRRYLSRALFNSIAEQIVHPDRPYTVDGRPPVTMSVEDAAKSEFSPLLAAARADRDGVGIIRLKDNYSAASINGETLIILPQFGEPISTFALFLVGAVILAVILVLAIIYYLMRRLTRPFQILNRGISRVEEGDLNYQIPLDKTYGEFKEFATAFNGMVAELQRIHEARRHMLLALPHEILTPLSRLKVRKEMVDNAELRVKIGKDITVVEEILSSILATERHQLREEREELVEIVPYVQEHILSQIDDDYPLRIVNATGFDVAFIDPFAVGVLLKNFVSNAVRYGNGRPITVRLRRDEEEPATIQISVEDKGIGISTEHLRYVTEPFWRADESRARASGGYGLGLYLCRRIVEGLGGQLKIDSTLGQGTTVTILLPNALCATIEDMAI